MAVDPQWLRTALEVTGDFETVGNPFAAVSGDFDGMGISCGVLQWNIGMGSLQPLVRAAGRARVIATMPRFGAELWRACGAAVAEGLRIVRAWQPRGALRDDVRAELAALLGSEPLVAQQLRAAGGVGDEALAQAAAWAAARGAAAVSLRDFCWFFDLLTQNGGLKGLGIADVRMNGGGGAAEAICDWLAGRGSAEAGFRDCRRNAELWRGQVGEADRDLFVLSYLRALKSRPEYRGVVLNRKGAIALRHGWVNGEHMNFRAKL
jgi:hypothetical protein